MPKGIPHRDPQGGAHRHCVMMEKDSMMFDIYGEGEIRVNSYHHQGIRKLAPGFRAGALAPDGLIEAFECKDESWFCVGVQWHPENEGNISLDMQLIEAFVSASAKGCPALHPRQGRVEPCPSPHRKKPRRGRGSKDLPPARCRFVDGLQSPSQLYPSHIQRWSAGANGK